MQQTISFTNKLVISDYHSSNNKILKTFVTHMISGTSTNIYHCSSQTMDPEIIISCGISDIFSHFVCILDM